MRGEERGLGVGERGRGEADRGVVLVLDDEGAGVVLDSHPPGLDQALGCHPACALGGQLVPLLSSPLLSIQPHEEKRRNRSEEETWRGRRRGRGKERCTNEERERTRGCTGGKEGALGRERACGRLSLCVQRATPALTRWWARTALHGEWRCEAWTDLTSSMRSTWIDRRGLRRSCRRSLLPGERLQVAHQLLNYNSRWSTLTTQTTRLR